MSLNPTVQYVLLWLVGGILARWFLVEPIIQAVKGRNK